MNTLVATMLSNWIFRASLNMMGYGNGPWDLSRLHQTFYVTLVEKVNRLFTLKETDVNDVDDQRRTALQYQRLPKTKETIERLINPQTNLQIVEDRQNHSHLYMAVGPTAFDSQLDEENPKESEQSKAITENLVQKINVCDQDSAFGKSKYEELPPSEPKIYCISCIESKAAAVQHSKGKEFKQPMLSSREPRIGERGISCANRVSVVIGDPTNDCSADVMEKQIILDSKVKLDKELQHKAVLKKRSLETSDQDGDDVENSEREDVTIYAVDSISVERVQSRIAEENQCKTFSDKTTAAPLQVENLKIELASSTEEWIETTTEEDADAKYQAQEIRKIALEDKIQKKFLSNFEKTQEEVQFLGKEKEQLLKNDSKLVMNNLSHNEVLEGNIAYERMFTNEKSCIVGLRNQLEESMAIIELRDREVRKLAFRNELMEKLAVKHEHIETEVLMLRQEKENLLQENARVLKEIEEKNDDLKQYEIKMVELESHIATLEMHLSELKKSHEDTMVLQQPSSNLKQQSKGMTESTTVLHETFHKSVEDSEEFIFQFNIETIDTLSGEQQLDFGIRSNECEQLIERKSKLCEDTSKVLTNGITLGQLNERCIDAECLQCQEEVGFQAKPHSTEQCSLERGLMIASALFDDPCNHVDVTAVEECYDRKHQWKQKALAIEARTISDLEEGNLSAHHIMRRNSILVIENQGLWELVDILRDKNRVIGSRLLEFSKKLHSNDEVSKVRENMLLSERNEFSNKADIDRKTCEHIKVFENGNKQILRSNCEDIDNRKNVVEDPESNAILEDEFAFSGKCCKAIEGKQLKVDNDLIDYLKIELKELRKNLNDLEIKNDELHCINKKLVGEIKKLGKQNRRLKKNLKSIDTPKVENIDGSKNTEKLSTTSINCNYTSKNFKCAVHESEKNVSDKQESKLRAAQKELLEWQRIGEFIRVKCDGKQKEQYMEAIRLDVLRQRLISLFNDYDRLKCTENVVKQLFGENEAIRQHLAVVASKNTELGNQLSRLALRERQFCEVKAKLSRVCNEKRLLERDVQQLTQIILEWEGWYYFSYYERV